MSSHLTRGGVPSSSVDACSYAVWLGRDDWLDPGVESTPVPLGGRAVAGPTRVGLGTFLRCYSVAPWATSSSASASLPIARPASPRLWRAAAT